MEDYYTGPAEQGTITGEYFLEEYHRFRAIMTNSTNSIERIDDALAALLFVYINIDPDSEKAELADQAFVSISDEWARRKVLLIYKLIKDGDYATKYGDEGDDVSDVIAQDDYDDGILQ